MTPLVFHVEAAGQFRPVELTFASEPEVRRLRAWRNLTPVTDAGEFAALAAKRWFYYSREGATVGSLERLQSAIAANKRSELAFLMVASARWIGRPRFFALAYCRRTWCHHLVLDFLAVRPGVLFENQPVAGIGSGVLVSLMELADSLSMEKMWGEATANSAPFYEKVLQTRPVQDLFIVQREKMRAIAQNYFASQKQRLAKTAGQSHIS